MKPPLPTSILSIDYGHKRIGLAGCDRLGITITRLEAIHRVSFQKDLILIKNLCYEREVKGLVIGLPLDTYGNSTLQSKHCMNYGKKIAKELVLPLAWVNEHSSTWAAGQKHNLQNDRSGKIDSAVAALLLEQWLREGPELKLIEKGFDI